MFLAQTQSDRAAGLAELNGVVHQIIQHLRESLIICRHLYVTVRHIGHQRLLRLLRRKLSGL